MLHNFSSLIDSYGMIPNGNRIYFTKRSQPPLFISMVEAFYEVNTVTKYRSLVKTLNIVVLRKVNILTLPSIGNDGP